MIRRLAAAACLLGWLGGAPVVASAQDRDPAAPFLGRTVVEVRLELEGEVTASTELLPLIDVRAGQPLRRADIRSSIGRMLSPGLARFDDVVVTVEPVDAGVRVVFRVVPRHPIVDLTVTGDSGLDPAELRQLILTRYGGVPTVERLVTVEIAAERILADRGYLDAQVTVRSTDHHVPHQSVLVIDVAAGPLAVIASVEVTGRSPLGAATVLERTGVRVGGPYRRREVQTRLDAIGNELRADRYYEAVARPSETREADGRVSLTLVVDAGPLVDLRFTGDLLPPGRPGDLVPVERERSADDDLLEDSRRRIEAALRDLGHKDARVVYTRVEADGGRVVITFDVTRGPRFLVGAVEWPAVLSVPPAELAIALAVTPGAPYSAADVDAGLRRVRALYLARGFYAVDIRPEIAVAAGQSGAGEPLVTIRPVIVEGARGTIREIAIERVGNALPDAALLDAMRSKTGTPYVASSVTLDQRAIVQRYLDLGFRTPEVRIRHETSTDGRDVRLRVAVNEGPQIFVEGIVVVGNRRISAEAVLDEMTLRPGEPFGAAEEAESVRRLRQIGIFRSVSIISEGLLPGETRANLIVSVEELPAITVGYGGGLEVGRGPRREGIRLVDQLQFAPRGFFEVTRRNLGGRNRAISLFSRLALKPRVQPVDDGQTDHGLFGFSEYRVTGTFSEQRAFGTDTSVLVGLTSEQAIRTSFNFIRQRANAEALRSLRPTVIWSGRYALDFSRLFDELIAEEDQPLIDRLFPQVRLSILSTGLSWDRRNQPLSPTNGTLATGDIEVALRSIGSEVGYAKTFLQVSTFRSLTPNARAVFAGRAQVGLARGFERQAPVVDAEGDPILDASGEAVTQLVADLPASQRFFAGGGSTVRGFQLDRLGVPEVLNPDGLSRGGNGLIVLNAELRAAAANILGRTLSVVGFVDGGNVFERARDFDLSRLRGALGFGVRYDSPLGPLRLDFGFKMNRNLIRGVRERGWEYHLSIGEIF